MDIVSELVPHMAPYLSINGLTGATYTYKARFGDKRFPIVEHKLHQKKGGTDSMLYLSIAADADLNALKPGQKLYVGAQSGIDRMFRGDGLKGQNFHHAQMRDGNAGCGLNSYLAAGGKVVIYAVNSMLLTKLTEKNTRFMGMAPMAKGSVKLSRGRDYAGFWFEQLILREEKSHWSWNSQGIQSEAQAILARHGV